MSILLPSPSSQGLPRVVLLPAIVARAAALPCGLLLSAARRVAVALPALPLLSSALGHALCLPARLPRLGRHEQCDARQLRRGVCSLSARHVQRRGGRDGLPCMPRRLRVQWGNDHCLPLCCVAWRQRLHLPGRGLLPDGLGCRNSVPRGNRQPARGALQLYGLRVVPCQRVPARGGRRVVPPLLVVGVLVPRRDDMQVGRMGSWGGA